MLRFPVKKIRKQFKLLLLLVLLTSAVWFTYLHINQGKTIKLHFNYGKGRESFKVCLLFHPDGSPGHHKSEDTSDSREDEAAVTNLMLLLLCALTCGLSCVIVCLQFKGQANLHVFEDWCGSSIAQLRKNLHFPLYPHTRTTVKKLAVAPKWKNYGLRIFGFLHPYRDGDFQFSVSSDDNSEFWLSPDESPLNARLLVYVGQLGTEWTAPGEFSKFRSQSSKSVHLISSRRYYFEILHKQDDKGSDHVEVGWRPFLPGLKYEVIDSAYISLYTDESSLKMNSVDHIPQTLASHIRLLEDNVLHGADMLKPDPRDTFYSTPMIDPSRLENVLPACLYSPTYVVKDFPIARYQGLQFVYLSFVYPNDFTRLTHMERENKWHYFVYLSEKEEEVVDTEDEAEIIGTQSPKKPSHPSQTSHTSNPSHQHSKPGPTQAGGEEEEEEEDPNEEEEGAVNSIVHRRERRHFPHSDRQMGRDLDRDWGRDHTKGSIRQDTRMGIKEAQPRVHQPDMDSVVRSRSLSWIHTDPQQPDPEPNPVDIDRDTNRSNPDPDPEPEPEEGEMSDYSYEEVEARPGWAEESINWQRTFSVNPMDFELLRSDWNDLRCNVSGNLQLAESEVVDVLAQYMEKLNEHNGGIYTLLRIINVEKRRDSARGNRYLVELELMERGRSVLRLSEYIYLLLHRGRQGEESLENTDSAPASAPASPLLCQPVMLQWRRDVMVHFVVPVKNQARWVQQFISDMENLHRQTKDDNFSIIIVDFESEDMDVEQALRESSVPRYEYLRREGNFERSAGLQIGVDTIEDSHSIVFLCDLHIHFPLNILESIRKHCVEGRLAFAPIVMRLSCGSSPQEPDGYWEVNGFGLFGIYKSDFDKIGGMNTEEFKDRWGGEDWELLDRVLQNGLEVERLRLRNFFHYYHSKRGMWNAQNKKTPKG
uniref:Beta-1,4-N-acetylgalactosaminyltransferase n=1 Tax=Amphiprion ocellaris TaxID=80972 RepID=A0AAQ6A9W7_AMPOC